MALPITRPDANLRRQARAVQMAARDVSAKYALSCHFGRCCLG
jgi:hypothetical protein